MFIRLFYKHKMEETCKEYDVLKEFYKDKCTANNIIRVIYSEDFTKTVATVHLVNGEERTVYMNRHWCDKGPPIEDPLDLKYNSKHMFNSFDLSYVPKKERTREICLQACDKGKELTYVPEALRDFELCVKFCKRDKQNLRFVPDALYDSVQNELQKKI
jgi:hypothetical protein